MLAVKCYLILVLISIWWVLSLHKQSVKTLYQCAKVDLIVRCNDWKWKMHSWALSCESYLSCHIYCDTRYSPWLCYVNTIWPLYKILLPLDHFRIEPKEWTRSWIQRKTQDKWDGRECSNRRLNRWQKNRIPRQWERTLFWSFKPFQYRTTDLPKRINNTYYC